MSGPKTGSTITGRGAEDKPQPATPQVITKERSRLRNLFSRNKNLSNGSVLASSSTRTLVIENTAPAPSVKVDVTTPNTKTGLAVGATTTEAPIAELWNEAWDELKKNTALFDEYEARLTTSSSTVEFPGLGNGERAQVMKLLLEKKIGELESGQWKVRFQNNQFAVRDLVQPVVGMVDWAKEYVGKAAQASPYSAVAWTGICLLLSLVLNPGEQEATRAKCLEGIAALLRQCSIREALYRSRYDGKTEKKEANLPVHISYREELKILYVRILTFQATCLCHLSHRTGGRIVRNMTVWTDWGELSAAIDTQKERMCDIETQWRDFKLQEQWNIEEKRHSEEMNYLDPMSSEIRRIREVTEKAQNDKIRLGLLQWLSSEDFSMRYNDIWRRREELTGEWLIENDSYNNWKKKPSSFLWLYGNAGSGKSHLSASAIHNLTELCEKSPYEAVAYYYFTYTNMTDPDASAMLSSMIRQLCGVRPDNPAWLNKLGSTFRDKGARPTLEHLESALWNAVEGFDAVYLIIDALDECTTSNSKRATLMKSLVRLQNNSPSNVHILVTSRKEPDIEAALNRVSLGLTEKIDLLQFRDVVNNDIDIYLHQRLASPEFDDVSDETKVLARRSLLEKADGMFQYVALQLIEIENSFSEDIPTLLANLPQGLEETYIRMLKSIDTRYYPVVYRILVWVAMSKRPLPARLLAEAAIIDPRKNPPFDLSERLERLKKPSGFLKLLPGLLHEVEIDSYEWGDNAQYGALRITFSHFSVQEFLFSMDLKLNPLEDVSRYALDKDEANHLIAESCMCYHLCASQQVTRVTKNDFVEIFPLWKLAVEQWATILEVFDEHLWTLSLIEKLRAILEPNTDSFLNMIRMKYSRLYADMKEEDISGYSANPTYYLSANGCLRVLSFYLKDLDAEKINAQVNCPPIQAIDSCGYPLQAAALQGSEGIVKLLLKCGADVNAQGGQYGNALQAAILQGSEVMVKLLLKHGADVNAQGGEYGNALQTAAQKGSEEMVWLLLEHGANVSTQGGYYGNALQAAAQKGSEKIVRLLLERGADVSTQGGHYGNVLQAAVATKSEGMVRLILAQGADVRAQGGYYGSALQAAIPTPSDRMVRFILAQGADVNAQGGKHGNPLQLATACGHEQTIRLLLEHGANVNAQGGLLGNALQTAASRGRERIVRLLLEKGANVSAQGGVFGNALQAAASRRGTEGTVRLLLDHGAKVNTQGGLYGNALQAAAADGSGGVVRLLLKEGADVNAQGGKYGNALQAGARSALEKATWIAAEEVVKLLLEHGADVNATGGKYGTALQGAAYGSEEMVRLLLEHGADVNLKGGKYGSAMNAARNGFGQGITKLLLAHGATE